MINNPRFKKKNILKRFIKQYMQDSHLPCYPVVAHSTAFFIFVNAVFFALVALIFVLMAPNAVLLCSFYIGGPTPHAFLEW